MGKLETVSVELRAEQVAAMEEAVAAGEFGTASEVVRVALSEWMERRTFSPGDVEVLRRMWEEGLASGDAVDVDFNEVREEAMRRLRAEAGVDIPRAS